MIYFNGNIVPLDEVKISPTDRGFLLSDGLFETMKARKGHVFDLKQHWERLKIGADFLKIPLLITFSELEKIIYELLKENNVLNQDASLRLTITRGSGPRGLLPPAVVNPTVMLTAAPISVYNEHSASVKIVSIRRNDSPLSQIKSLNYLENILARMEAVAAGATEAILLNSKECVAEASAANIFLVTKEGVLLTPRLSDGALPGVTRQIVINLAKEIGIPVKETAISIDVLKQAKEIFLTNSIIEIQSVGKLEDMILLLRKDSISQKLRTRFQNMIEKNSTLGKEQKDLATI